MPDLTPEYMRIIEQFDEAIESLWLDESVQMLDAWRMVEEALQAELEALARQIAGMANPSRGKLYRLARFKALLVQLNEEMQAFIDVAEPEMQAHIRQAALLGTIKADVFANTVSVAAGFDRLDAESVQNLVALLQEDAPLRSLLENAYPAAADGIADQLIRNVALGLNPLEIARAARQYGLSQGLNHLYLVSRDQQLRAYRTSNMTTYERNGVQKVKRLASKSLRTCFMCLDLDGKIYDIGEHPELHPQDRCQFIPIFEGWNPTWETGSEWLEKQDDAAQQSILGKGRFALWKAGTPLSEMYTSPEHAVWGPGLATKKLKEIEND